MEDVSYKYTCMILIFTCIFFLNNLKKKKVFIWLPPVLNAGCSMQALRLRHWTLWLRFSGSRAQAQRLKHLGLVAPRHMRS